DEVSVYEFQILNGYIVIRYIPFCLQNWEFRSFFNKTAMGKEGMITLRNQKEGIQPNTFPSSRVRQWFNVSTPYKEITDLLITLLAKMRMILEIDGGYLPVLTLF